MIHLLALVSLADRAFSDQEKIFIRNIARRYNIDDNTLNRILNNPNLLNMEGLTAFSSEKKSDALLSCMEVILSDGVITPQEIIALKRIAIHMGLKIGIIDFILHRYPSITHHELAAAITSEYA